MAFPVAQGTPSHSGTYTPTKWSKKAQVKFYNGTCLNMISNTEYEGEVKDFGDTVKIRTKPDIAIHTYVKGMDLNGKRQQPTTSLIELLIDKGIYWGWIIDGLDVKQSDIKFMDHWAEDVSNQKKITVETAVFADIYDEAASGNSGVTAGVSSSSYDLGAATDPFVVTADNVTQLLTDMESTLDEQNVPEEDRWAVLPPWFFNKMKNSDLSAANIMGDARSILRVGLKGMYAGFELYKNQNLYSVTDGGTSKKCWYALFGHVSALTFAMQYMQERVIPNPNAMNNIHEGYMAYGYKVVQPKSLGVAYLQAVA